MRYRLDISLNQSDEIPKDKNRMILSFLKHILRESDEEFFIKLYENGSVMRKNFTYSLYMKDAKFLRDTIKIPDKKLILNLSIYDMLTGLQIYNAIAKSMGNKFIYRGTVEMHIEKVELLQEKIFTTNTSYFKTLSPIVIREHNKLNNKDWYHDIDTDNGKQLFLDNLKRQIFDSIPEAKCDIENIKIDIIKNKLVKVKHYGIEILSNICMFKMEAEPYILEYCYKAGIGSMKNTGFGMIELIGD